MFNTRAHARTPHEGRRKPAASRLRARRVTGKASRAAAQKARDGTHSDGPITSTSTARAHASSASYALKEYSSPCASFLTSSLLSPNTISGSVMPSFAVQLPRARDRQRGACQAAAAHMQTRCPSGSQARRPARQHAGAERDGPRPPRNHGAGAGLYARRTGRRRRAASLLPVGVLRRQDRPFGRIEGPAAPLKRGRGHRRRRRGWRRRSRSAQGWVHGGRHSRRPGRPPRRLPTLRPRRAHRRLHLRPARAAGCPRGCRAGRANTQESRALSAGRGRGHAAVTSVRTPRLAARTCPLRAHLSSPRRCRRALCPSPPD